MARQRNPEGLKAGKLTFYGVEVEPRDYERVKRLFYALAGELPTSSSWDDFATTVQHAKDVLSHWRGIVDAGAAKRGVRVVR